MVFPVVMQRCKSWNIKKAERWRTDTFKLWCWRKLFRVLWTARSNQSILMEINLEYSLEGLVLKLKLQYFGPLMQATDSLKRPWCWERLRARGEGGDRGWDGWMASEIQWTWVWANSGSWWRIQEPGVLQSMGITKSQTPLSDWKQQPLSLCPKSNQLIYPDHLISFKFTFTNFLHLSITVSSDHQQEEKGTTEDEMAGWHHWLDGREFERTLGVGMDREAWRAAIHGVAKSRTRLSDWAELN